MYSEKHTEAAVMKKIMNWFLGLFRKKAQEKKPESEEIELVATPYVGLNVKYVMSAEGRTTKKETRK